MATSNPNALWANNFVPSFPHTPLNGNLTLVMDAVLSSKQSIEPGVKHRTFVLKTQTNPADGLPSETFRLDKILTLNSVCVYQLQSTVTRRKYYISADLVEMWLEEIKP